MEDSEDVRARGFREVTPFVGEYGPFAAAPAGFEQGHLHVKPVEVFRARVDGSDRMRICSC